MSENMGNEENKLLKYWHLFQKHSFTYVIFIVIGMLIGVVATKTVYEKEVDTAIQLQRFVKDQVIYDISLSSISKPDIKQAKVIDKK